MASIQVPNAPWSRFSGMNLAYLQALYEKYEIDPGSIAEEWQNYFARWGAPTLNGETVSTADAQLERNPLYEHDIKKIVAASELLAHIRHYGHLAAGIYPFPEQMNDSGSLLDPSVYRLSCEDLEAIPAGIIWEEAPADVHTAWEAVLRLMDIYTKTTAYQFAHVNDSEEREWLTAKVENSGNSSPLSDDERSRLLYRLLEVDHFEKFLHRTFLGQKRFSIEGVDCLVPMLDEIVHMSARDELSHVMFGMAHRGRLNVLAHILEKPYEAIFSEFHHTANKHLVPSEGSMGINYGWTGDVKYHLGATREVQQDGKQIHSIRLTLANNPSHLEFVDPIVLGFARSVQDDRSQAGYPRQRTDTALAVLVHGDAAFPGEGVVEETLNLSRLPGYQVGGTIHIIANNGLGFTAESKESRSTKYASDLAKGFEIPIVHVNADDPEACLMAIRLAYEYRQKYHKDFLIDLIGYRRYGHNESDDPMATQPQLYRQIEKHRPVAELYSESCVSAEILSQDKLAKWKQEIAQKLQSAYDRLKTGGDQWTVPPVGTFSPAPDGGETGVSLAELRDINQQLLTFPQHFHVYSKLERILKRRTDMLADSGSVDWALGEVLAFAAILKEGTAIRMTGQDTERGTFAHRHLVLHDAETGGSYSPLHQLTSASASFAIHNSPLAEASVLGYEYGYSVYAPKVMVIWEAQFGDFANVAQVIIDQFISSARAKWKELSGLTLLLPHGYEGQGPEHSSARLERFLQLSAENNWTVCNVTSSAQYFHLLRRQAQLIGTEYVRPLIVMSPKSLLRNPRASSPVHLLTKGSFAKVLEQPGTGDADKVTRLIFCSGKVAIDLEAKWGETSAEARSFLRIIRLEQLYPFPEQELTAVFQRYPRVQEAFWVQEEPQNMGAWYYMAPRIKKLAGQSKLRYIGRPEHSSPAEGQPEVHQAEQSRIVTEAFKPLKEVVYHGNQNSGIR